MLFDKNGMCSFRVIKSRDEHFRVCNRCKSINYFSNKRCVLCHREDLDNSDWYDINTHTEITKEYSFYYRAGFDTNTIDELRIVVVENPNVNLREPDKNRRIGMRYRKQQI